MKIAANNIQINYESSGNHHGNVVVLSHVIGSSLVMWDPQIDVLNEKFKVIRYDTRGLGLSCAPHEPYSMAMLVADAVAFLDALQLRQVHWVGLSLGGMIGMGLAIHYPDRLLSLTLCDSMARVREETKHLWRDRIAARSMESLVEGAVMRWFTESFRESQAPGYLTNRRQFLASSLKGYIGNCHAILNLDYMDDLVKIQTPTKLIVGELDQATPVSDSIAIQDRIAGSDMDIVEGGAHLCNVEQADRFNKILMEFLNRF